MSAKRIYFLRPVGQIGPIKIGCSVAPDKRLIAIQAWSPLPLELVAICVGKNAHEQNLHARFIADRLHGEWFIWSEELQYVMDHVASHGELPQKYLTVPQCPEEWRAFYHGRAGKMVKGSARLHIPEGVLPTAEQAKAA